MAAGLVVASIIPYNNAQKDNQRYNSIITELQPVYDSYLEYLELKNDVRYVESLDAATINRNEDLVELLETLENEMPQSLVISSMSSTRNAVVINATVGSKEEVAYTLSKIKNMGCFISADLNSVAEVENAEAGEIVYSFVIQASYAPIETLNPEEGEEVTE